MKARYIARVFFFSIEFFIILIAIASIFLLKKQADIFIGLLNINSEIGKYLILLPTAIIVWMLKEGRDFLGSDKKLINWPDYWKLKSHVYISYLYAVIFFLAAVAPAISTLGISNGVGLILFISGILGCLWAAGSIYFAQIRAKEILNQEFLG